VMSSTRVHGKTYEMCWCQPSPTSLCNSVTDFATNVGALHVLQGPFSPQTGSPYTCTRGPNCVVTLEGERLGSRDRLSVMETCGGRSVDGFEGLCRDGSCIASAADPPTRDGTRFTWSADIVNATAGSYRLCWCHGSIDHDCLTEGAFFRDVGEMIVKGSPDYGQYFRCVSGHLCSLTVVGQDITGTWIRVMSACGSGESVAGLPEISVQGVGSNTGVADFSFASRISALAVTKARLCWCSDAGTGSCSSAKDFGMDFGFLLPLLHIGLHLNPIHLGYHALCMQVCTILCVK
jgi:hypothetical protein